jgi:hypothetical protein
MLPLGHAFGERYELPLPLWLFVAGGAAVVVLSFLLVLRRTAAAPRTVDTEDEVPLTPLRPVRATIGIVLTLFVAVTGLTGSQEVSENIAPLYLWLLLWIVVPLTAGLLGDWTRPWNPFANLARVGGLTSVRRAVLARSDPLPWRAGWWPALLVFLLLVLGELVFNLDTTKPSFVGAALLGYLVLCLFLGLLFGDGFLRRGEVFSGLWDAWGRLGFWRHGAPGRRGFAGGLDVPFEASAGRVVFVLLMLISINFDGLLSTPQWARYEDRVLDAGSVSQGAARECLDSGCDAFRVVSLLVLVALVLAVFGAFAVAASRAGGLGLRPLASLAWLLPSLLPIAYGYLAAHYLQYVVTNGQLLFPLIGNPGYDDWPLSLPSPFDDDYEVRLDALPNSIYWYVSVLAIVVVHVVAVVLANNRLRARAADESRARRSEYPWLVAMVAYTVFSLVLIAQPLTTGS